MPEFLNFDEAPARGRAGAGKSQRVTTMTGAETQLFRVRPRAVLAETRFRGRPSMGGECADTVFTLAAFECSAREVEWLEAIADDTDKNNALLALMAGFAHAEPAKSGKRRGILHRLEPIGAPAVSRAVSMACEECASASAALDVSACKSACAALRAALAESAPVSLGVQGATAPANLLHGLCEYAAHATLPQVGWSVHSIVRCYPAWSKNPGGNLKSVCERVASHGVHTLCDGAVIKLRFELDND
jgi:hypothetical protein